MSKDELKRDVIILKNISYLTETAKLQISRKYPFLKLFLPRDMDGILEFLSHMLPAYLAAQDKLVEPGNGVPEPSNNTTPAGRMMMFVGIFACAITSFVWAR